jgi:hypothetical protein
MSNDLRIVGVFIRRQVTPPRHCGGSRDDKDQDDQNEISPVMRL